MSEVSVFKPTDDLSRFFGEPALVGQEKIEIYNEVFSMVASSIRPTDSIGWFLTKDVADLLWDSRANQDVE